MRIDKIKISWFRGSADPIELDFRKKSIVVYGENGSGKSSFVDAVEHIVNIGKIFHLAHEYSGRKQERAIINTHMPGSQSCQIELTLADGSTVESRIARNGSFTLIPSPCMMTSWDYRRTILRQNEVSDFITDTKGNKYSALLPLLGLNYLEITAENLRKLVRQMQITSSFEANSVEIQKGSVKRKIVFGAANGLEIRRQIEDLFKKYNNAEEAPDKFTQTIEETSKAIEIKINDFTKEQKRYSQLLEFSKVRILENIEIIKKSSLDLVSTIQPLVLEKIKVLQSSISYAEKLTQEEIECPACGRKISSVEFHKHLQSEEKSLKEIVQKKDEHIVNLNHLCDSIQRLKGIISDPLIAEWRSKQDNKNISYLERLDVNPLRQSIDEDIVSNIEKEIIPILESAISEVNTPMPDVADILKDKEKVDAAKDLARGHFLEQKNKSVQFLIDYLNDLQKTYRDQIRIQSSTAIASISTDIARMWEILHPGEKVEDVRLLFPQDVDKAIEVGLKFYGFNQDSPRLTLSEGHRNSLGLCIFLAMAKKDVSIPIILDDVVVSFDRNHRGRLGFLLESEFPERQVLLFTHERDWYIELRRQLDPIRWEFKTLMPWESPDIGIRLSSKQYTFDDARAMVADSPDAAGNTARKIMDISVAVLAESLNVSLPYLHRERNDHRTAHEFLEKMSSRGAFQIRKEDKSYEDFKEAIDDLRLATRLLGTWGNRASHDFNITKVEAIELINVCERTLGHFKCSSCNYEVNRLDDEKAEFKQCRCGQLKWKY